MSSTRQLRDAAAVRVASAVLFGALLVTLAALLPLSGNEDHAIAHLTFAVPLLLLVGLIVRTPSVSRRSQAGGIARYLLLAGLLLLGGGALVEGIGAAGYDDSDTRTNDLALLHDLGVLITPLGIVLILAGAITSLGVRVAARRGAAGSWYVTAALICAAVAVVAFVAGAVVFGY